MLTGIFIVSPDYWVYISANPLIGGIVFVIGGYLLGYASNVLHNKLLVKQLNKFFGNPFSSSLSDPEKNKFNVQFSEIVKQNLIEYWGSDIFNIGEQELVYLCWRDIQKTNHNGIEYLHRIVSLWNFCSSSVFPCIFTGLILLFKGCFVASIVCFVLCISFIISRVNMRRQFVKNIYRIWYVINKSNDKNIS
ncbi:hypothetical protein [Desulfosarcina ovata]|nr:hypothetical protein [Desulfosarcina ovata]